MLYWMGVALGPAAWAINLQTVYTFAHFTCEKARIDGTVLGIILAIVSLLGTLISARAISRSANAEWADAEGGVPRTFMAWLGAGSGIIFALAIANQIAAALLISPCLR
jgi:hypothetical protein